MIRRKPVQTELAVAGATAAAVVALIVFFALSGLSHPDRYKARVAALKAELAQTQALLRSPGDAGAYPPKAICHGSPDQAALDLRQRLQAQSAAASVTVAELFVTPASDSSDSPPTPVLLRFQGSGHYEAVVGLLGTLAKSQPEIFVDTLDLTPDATNSKLKLTGRVLCSTSARP